MIYDCFTFFNELDLLELRLNELSGIVDRFVLVESVTTHQGHQKPLYFQENQSRFAKFLEKIIHVKCEFPDKLPRPDRGRMDEHWSRENFQRNEIRRGLNEAKPDDLIIVSDVDEVISSKALEQTLKHRPHGSLTTFELQWLELYVDRLIAAWHAQGPRMIEFKYLNTAQKLRNAKPVIDKSLRFDFLIRSHARLWNWKNCGIAHQIFDVRNAGWHFSSLGGPEKLQEKLAAVAPHSGSVANSKNRDEFIAKNKMPTQEIGILSFENLPDFIKQNSSRFSFSPKSEM